jgi:hypothetical protein
VGVPAGARTFGRIAPIAQCVRPSAGDTRVATATFASPWLRKRVDCTFECRDPRGQEQSGSGETVIRKEMPMPVLRRSTGDSESMIRRRICRRHRNYADRCGSFSLSDSLQDS